MSAPTSTYRLQLRPEFGFAEAQALVPYLRDLGVGAVYVSPVLDATPGSTHGYDVTDPTQARPELGGPEGWDAFTATVRDAGLGLVVDVVPNHMSVEVPPREPVVVVGAGRGRGVAVGGPLRRRLVARSRARARAR
ncbi:MAG: alpha-amylase family glycosyl hydrolase [Aeromicrobium erythreum]